MSPPVTPALLALQDQAAPGGPSPLVMMLGVLVIFLLVAVVPERKQRKKKQAMLDAMKKNDRVVTSAGILATVTAVGENEVTLRLEEGRVKVLKSSIATVLDKEGEAAG